LDTSSNTALSIALQTISESTFEKSPIDLEKAAPAEEEKSAEDLDDLYGEESTSRVRLPADGVNANRTVPGFCAICLCPYEPADKVSWSPESDCIHAFHTECIVPWLAKKEEQKCPVCRQEYCQPVQIEDDVVQEDIFLDSFALALNYARRSQALRSSWATQDMHNRQTALNGASVVHGTVNTTTTPRTEAPNQQQGENGGQVEMTATASGVESASEVATTTATSESGNSR
jgi:hypothetical protein